VTLGRLSLGKKGEAVARHHLEKLGYTILEQNYKVKIGEIDMIAEHGNDLVFIEVKTRSSTTFGHPAEAVTRTKQHKIIRTAQYYLSCKKHKNRSMRFDVVAVLFSRQGVAKVEVIRDAFELS